MMNNGTIGGKVNLPYKTISYTGLETDTAKVTVDNGARTIAVDTKHVAVIDLNSLMSAEVVSQLVQYAAGLDESQEKRFAFTSFISIKDYVEYQAVKLQYVLLGGEPSSIIFSKKDENKGEPTFTYEDVQSSVVLKLLYSGILGTRPAPIDAYTRAESDTKFLTKINAQQIYQEKLTAGTNITIENNVISATGNVTEEELQQAIDDATADLEAEINLKQDTISDLADIRAGAALGATALQEVPSEYVTESELTSELAVVDTKVDSIDDKLNENVLIENGNKLSYNGDTVTLTFSNKNLKSGASGINAEVIELADEDTAGLMSYTDYNTLWSLADRVNALEGTKVRIAYTAGSDPTAAQIKSFVDTYFAERGKPSPTDEDYNSVSVVVDSTKHIWNYYANNHAYQDDGLDTVSQFTNETAGIIKGKNTDGFVYAETDGTGSVKGWSDLKTRVDNLESKNDTQDQEISALQNDVDALEASVATKQDLLVSGTNIKTINNQSIVGSGNLEINSGVWGNITGTLSNQTDLQAALNAKQDIPAIDEDEYFTIPAPIFSIDTLSSSIENLDVELAWKLIGDHIGEKHQYIDNFGEVWELEATSESSADVVLIVGDKKYNASFFIETDETGVSQITVDGVSVEDIAAKSDIPAAVSGTTDGTNWTSITIGSDTYDIPSGEDTTEWISSSDDFEVIFKALEEDPDVEIDGYTKNSNYEIFEFEALNQPITQGHIYVDKNGELVVLLNDMYNLSNYQDRNERIFNRKIVLKSFSSAGIAAPIILSNFYFAELERDVRLACTIQYVNSVTTTGHVGVLKGQLSYYKAPEPHIIISTVFGVINLSFIPRMM